MQELLHNVFRARLHSKTHNKDVPLKCFFEPTLKCNLKCVHCYIPKSASKTARMPKNKILRLLDKIASCGCLWLIFTGGEPFLRKDFPDIYLYAKKKGFLIVIFSNATLVTPQLAKMLTVWRPLFVEVSIYGCTRKTYEAVTKVAGSFENFKKGLGLLISHKIPLSLKMPLLTINKHELGMARKWAKELDVPFRFDAAIYPGLDGSLVPFSYRLKPKEVVNAEMQFKEKLEYFKNKISVKKSRLEKEYIFDECGAGQNAFCVCADGSMSMCMLARVPGSSLAGGRIKEAWLKLQKISDTILEDNKKCLNCKIRYFCDYCLGAAAFKQPQASGANLVEAMKSHYCETAALRANYFRAKNNVIRRKNNQTV
ncbi:MAG: radical SAM protein [Candidatus Omnitrophica bacterium]|nr:radical SAM protein [Candidatus Omnitrophota bacterium]